jgi:hypothetical protein
LVGLAWCIEGLFRLSGNHAKIENMVQEWNTGVHTFSLLHSYFVTFIFEQNSGNYFIDSELDAHDVTGLLKRFFKDLKEPLVTNVYHSKFMEIACKWRVLARFGNSF